VWQPRLAAALSALIAIDVLAVPWPRLRRFAFFSGVGAAFLKIPFVPT